MSGGMMEDNKMTGGQVFRFQDMTLKTQNLQDALRR